MSVLTLQSTPLLIDLVRDFNESMHSAIKKNPTPITKIQSPKYIAEGRSAITKKGQGIDFRMLSSCFTITAKLSNDTLLGAHFAHFGKDAGGMNPKQLVKTVRTALSFTQEKNVKITEFNVIGNLELWDPTYIGLSRSCGKSLAIASAQKAFAEKLGVSPEIMKVVDTSNHDFTYLAISPNGEPKMKFSED